MFDFHVHTCLSDSKMTPSTAIRGAKLAGYRGIALTDHADHATMAAIIPQVLRIIRSYSLHAGIEVFAGVELTHVPPALIPDAIAEARALGAQLVLVHGEAIGDFVEQGTNLAAIEGRADILAHPGLITDQDAAYAAERKILLEITTRPRNALANGHVAATARRHSAPCIINNDAHTHTEFVSPEIRRAVALGAACTPAEYAQMEANSRALYQKLLKL
ncbi:MAG: histidinol phosphate phosphatase domain-containing protein [Pseudomonadota bacterium]